MLKIFIPIILFSFVSLLLANEATVVGDEAIKFTNTALKEVKSINEGSLLQTPCTILNAGAKNITRSCAEISDNFCSKLWNEKNKGNIKVFDGEIKAGKSENSEISLSTLENDKALIGAISHLSIDAKTALEPVFAEFKNVLDQESDDMKWYRKRSAIKQKINDAIDDLIDQRFEKRYPEIKIKDSKKWTIDQTLLYKKEARIFNDELIAAKYSNHPNWIRVEKIFPQIKTKLAQEIDKLKIPEERKKLMKDKVLSIKLSLPLQDPDSVEASDECSTTEVNAFYTSATKKFTVCAGLFNRYQSDSAITFVLLHEVAHSIDSENLAKDDWRLKSPVAKVLKKLAHSDGPVYKCDEWKNVSDNVLIPGGSFSVQDADPLENLYSCLRGKQKLDEMNIENVSNAVKNLVKNTIDNYANANAFTAIAQKQMKKDGKLQKNEIYLRPDKFLENNNGYNDQGLIRNSNPVEIFTQNFSCILSQSNLTEAQYESASTETRSKLFENAIEQTSKNLQVQNEDYFKYCGRNCSQLTSFDLSVNPQEKIADWFATLSYPAFLENVLPENRAEASALTTSLFCDSSEIPSASPELALSEKKFSLETHPDDRSRRVSLYTPEVAKLIDCKNEIDGEKGSVACQP
jgi:hypothetical protein